MYQVLDGLMINKVEPKRRKYVVNFGVQNISGSSFNESLRIYHGCMDKDNRGGLPASRISIKPIKTSKKLSQG